MKVFISSTAKDLSPYRRAAADAVLRMGWHPVLIMEHELIPGGVPLAECMERAAECDAFVLLAGLRCGFVPSELQGGDSRRSITRWELYAWRKVCDEYEVPDPIVFLGQHPTLPCGAGENERAATLQTRFRERLQEEYVTHDFAYRAPEEPDHSTALRTFTANLQTQLAELKRAMLEEERERLHDERARAERWAQRHAARRRQAESERDSAVLAAGAAIAFGYWMNRTKK